MIFYEKLELSCYKNYCVNLPGLINRELDLTDLTRAEHFALGIKGKNLATIYVAPYAMCVNLL